MHGFLEVPLALKLLRAPSDQRVLVLGCGGVVAFPALAHRCRPARLVGIDNDGSFLAHPLRTSGRRLPWRAAPALAPQRNAMFWKTRIKQ